MLVLDILENNFLVVFSISLGILFPCAILYSRFIYKKYGKFITIFNHPKYHPLGNYKDFISKNKVNYVFGVMTFILWSLSGFAVVILIGEALYKWISG